VGAIEESGNQTFSEGSFCALGCPEEEREEEKLAAVALTPSVGPVGSGGTGAISWLLMLAISSALGLLGWMRRRKTAKLESHLNQEARLLPGFLWECE